MTSPNIRPMEPLARSYTCRLTPYTTGLANAPQPMTLTSARAERTQAQGPDAPYFVCVVGGAGVRVFFLSPVIPLFYCTVYFLIPVYTVADLLLV